MICMKKKHEEFAEIELFPEIFSEEKLEEEKNPKKEIILNIFSLGC